MKPKKRLIIYRVILFRFKMFLTDKKSRGIYGEVNLKHILANVFGEKNDTIYRLRIYSAE